MILRTLIWIWAISFLFMFVWLKMNKKWVNDFYNEKYTEFTFEFYELLLYLVSFIIAPLLAPITMFTEIIGWVYIKWKKVVLLIKISKLKDNEAKKELRTLIKNVKL
jgi:hypothetical protein